MKTIVKEFESKTRFLDDDTFRNISDSFVIDVQLLVEKEQVRRATRTLELKVRDRSALEKVSHILHTHDWISRRDTRRTITAEDLDYWRILYCNRPIPVEKKDTLSVAPQTQVKEEEEEEESKIEKEEKDNDNDDDDDDDDDDDNYYSKWGKQLDTWVPGDIEIKHTEETLYRVFKSGKPTVTTHTEDTLYSILGNARSTSTGSSGFFTSSEEHGQHGEDHLHKWCVTEAYQVSDTKSIYFGDFYVSMSIGKCPLTRQEREMLDSMDDPLKKEEAVDIIATLCNAYAHYQVENNIHFKEIRFYLSAVKETTKKREEKEPKNSSLPKKKPFVFQVILEPNPESTFSSSSTTLLSSSPPSSLSSSNPSSNTCVTQSRIFLVSS